MVYDFSHTSFVCCDFVTDCQMGRLLGHMWNLLEFMLCKLANPLTSEEVLYFKSRQLAR